MNWADLAQEGTPLASVIQGVVDGDRRNQLYVGERSLAFGGTRPTRFPVKRVESAYRATAVELRGPAARVPDSAAAARAVGAASSSWWPTPVLDGCRAAAGHPLRWATRLFTALLHRGITVLGGDGEPVDHHLVDGRGRDGGTP